jgi:predicted transcriptional regulator
MAKLDPIVSEFATEEDAAAYDLWFRAQVEEGMRSEGPWIPHEEVMASVQRILKKLRDVGPCLVT